MTRVTDGFCMTTVSKCATEQSCHVAQFVDAFRESPLPTRGNDSGLLATPQP